MTAGFINKLRKQGYEISGIVSWPINWINFRMHPRPHWPGVRDYRDAIREGDTIQPVVLCSECYVILDGWHRVAAHWLEGKRFVPVVFTDKHWMNGDICRVDKTHWIDTLKPYNFDMPISCSYHRKDFENEHFGLLHRALKEFGEHFPKMRYWEQVKAIMYLGNLNGKRVLDVGTRESLAPHYLASQWDCDVTCIDLDADAIVDDETVTVMQADARDLPFEDGYFDAVLSTACLKHIPGYGDSEAVREFGRVVTYGGHVALSFDFGREYHEYPSKISGRRIYDKQSVYTRLVDSNDLSLVTPADFDRSDWNDWPIKAQAPSVYDKGFNLQVAFVLLRKE